MGDFQANRRPSWWNLSDEQFNNLNADTDNPHFIVSWEWADASEITTDGVRSILNREFQTDISSSDPAYLEGQLLTTVVNRAIQNKDARAFGSDYDGVLDSWEAIRDAGSAKWATGYMELLWTFADGKRDSDDLKEVSAQEIDFLARFWATQHQPEPSPNPEGTPPAHLAQHELLAAYLLIREQNFEERIGNSQDDFRISGQDTWDRRNNHARDENDQAMQELFKRMDPATRAQLATVLGRDPNDQSFIDQGTSGFIGAGEGALTESQQRALSNAIINGRTESGGFNAEFISGNTVDWNAIYANASITLPVDRMLAGVVVGDLAPGSAALTDLVQELQQPQRFEEALRSLLVNDRGDRDGDGVDDNIEILNALMSDESLVALHIGIINEVLGDGSIPEAKRGALRTAADRLDNVSIDSTNQSLRYTNRLVEMVKSNDVTADNLDSLLQGTGLNGVSLTDALALARGRSEGGVTVPELALIASRVTPAEFNANFNAFTSGMNPETKSEFMRSLDSHVDDTWLLQALNGTNTIGTDTERTTWGIGRIKTDSSQVATTSGAASSLLSAIMNDPDLGDPLKYTDPNKSPGCPLFSFMSPPTSPNQDIADRLASELGISGNFDSNGDGKIDRTDLLEAIEQRLDAIAAMNPPPPGFDEALEAGGEDLLDWIQANRSFIGDMELSPRGDAARRADPARVASDDNNGGRQGDQSQDHFIIQQLVSTIGQNITDQTRDNMDLLDSVADFLPNGATVTVAGTSFTLTDGALQFQSGGQTYRINENGDLEIRQNDAWTAPTTPPTGQPFDTLRSTDFTALGSVSIGANSQSFSVNLANPGGEQASLDSISQQLTNCIQQVNACAVAAR